MWGRTMGAFVRASPSHWLVAVCLFIMLMPSATATDFEIERGEQDWVFTSQDETVAGELDEEASIEEEHYVWLLGSGLDRLVGEIVVPAEHFDVERSRQVVPMVDETFFSHRSTPQRVDEAENPSRVVNITTGEGGDITYRVAFPGDPDSELKFSLTRDVAPPGFEVGPVQNVTHNSFYVETETDEPALGTLRVWRSDEASSDAVEHPTQTPSVTQRFPIRGLQSDTGYRFHMVFEDWAGNQIESDAVDLTTASKDVGESPLIHRVSPEPDATLDEPPESIEAEFEAVEGSFGSGGVRLFVDLDEVTAQSTFDEERIRYAPSEPLEAGGHVVRLELVNSAGGEADMRWEFTVDEPESVETVLPITVVLFTGAVVLFVLTVKRRPD